MESAVGTYGTVKQKELYEAEECGYMEPFIPNKPEARIWYCKCRNSTSARCRLAVSHSSARSECGV